MTEADSCLGVWRGPSKYSHVCMGCHEECYRSRRRAKDVVFPATRELWRFLVSTTLYSIWIERLRRLEDATLPQEVCNARAKTQFRRAVMRFQNSTYQPDMGEYGLLFTRVRSELADILICFSDPPPLRASPLGTLSGVFYLLSSTEDQEEILDRVDPDPSLSNFRIRRTPHASCGYQTWLTILQTSSTMSLNTGDLCMTSLAATHLCMLRGTVQSCFRNSGRTTLHTSHTWRCYF